MTSQQWRTAFIELAEDIFRELGFPPPAMIFEESLPLSMDLQLEDHQFELLHSDNDLADHILVSCKLGSLPRGAEHRGFCELMKENLTQVRTAGQYFGIDSETRSVKLMFFQALSTTSAPLLLEQMRTVVTQWNSWEEKFFSNDSFSSMSSDDASPLLLA